MCPGVESIKFVNRCVTAGRAQPENDAVSGNTTEFCGSIQVSIHGLNDSRRRSEAVMSKSIQHIHGTGSTVRAHAKDSSGKFVSRKFVVPGSSVECTVQPLEQGPDGNCSI